MYQVWYNKEKRREVNKMAWVLNVETGKKENVRSAEIIADWLNDKPKYKEIEKNAWQVTYKVL